MFEGRAHSCSSAEDAFWKASEASDVETEGSVGDSRDDAVEEDDAGGVAWLLKIVHVAAVDGGGRVRGWGGRRGWEGRGGGGGSVLEEGVDDGVVSHEEAGRSDGGDDVVECRIRNGSPVVGGGASAELKG